MLNFGKPACRMPEAQDFDRFGGALNAINNPVGAEDDFAKVCARELGN
jgi:hypothetical protein